MKSSTNLYMAIVYGEICIGDALNICLYVTIFNRIQYQGQLNCMKN